MPTLSNAPKDFTNYIQNKPFQPGEAMGETKFLKTGKKLFSFPKALIKHTVELLQIFFEFLQIAHTMNISCQDLQNDTQSRTWGGEIWCDQTRLDGPKGRSGLGWN